MEKMTDRQIREAANKVREMEKVGLRQLREAANKLKERYERELLDSEFNGRRSHPPLPDSEVTDGGPPPKSRIKKGDSMDIKGILLEEIGRLGYSKTKLAKETGLPLTTISEWMNNNRDIGTNKIGAIAEFLGFEFGPSEQRRKEMKQYLADILVIQKAGFDLMGRGRANIAARNWRYLEERGYGFTNEECELLEEIYGLVVELEAAEVDGTRKTAIAIRKFLRSIKTESPKEESGPVKKAKRHKHIRKILATRAKQEEAKKKRVNARRRELAKKKKPK